MVKSAEQGPIPPSIEGIALAAEAVVVCENANAGIERRKRRMAAFRVKRSLIALSLIAPCSLRLRPESTEGRRCDFPNTPSLRDPNLSEAEMTDAVGVRGSCYQRSLPLHRPGEYNF